MLQPNATHLLQPLDVAVFSSLKRLWRVILDEWKRKVPTEASFDKKYFPSFTATFNEHSRTKYENLQ